MEKILKKICLEPAINRLPNNLPYYKGNDDTEYRDNEMWGNYSADIIIPKTSDPDSECTLATPSKLLDLIPMTDLGDGTILIRYKNLMYYYYWLINKFIPSCSFYQRCNFGQGYKSVEVNTKPFIPTNVYLLESIEDRKNVPITEYFCVTNLFSEFVEKFETLDKAYDYVLFVLDVIYMSNEIRDGLTFSIPYIDLNFYLASSENNIGMFSPIYKTWEKNTKFYIGDIVIYNEIPYKLIRGEGYDIMDIEPLFYTSIEEGIGSGNFILLQDESKINETVLSDTKHLYFISYFTDGVIIYKQVKPYYMGYYDLKDHTTYFENEEDVFNRKPHWSEERIITIDDSIKSGITESRLQTFKRKKTSVDDDGKILPFIVPVSALTNDTELIYLLGKTNQTNNGINNYYDELERVNFYIDKYSSNPIGSISSTETDIINTSGITSGTSVIEFVYTLGNKITNNILIPGIHYRDRYSFEMSGYTCNYDGESGRTFIYCNINQDYTLTDSEITDDIIDSGSNPLFSEITYGNNHLQKYTYNLDVFMDETKSGLQYINKDIDLTMDRGVSECFERHNILGEIKTMQDLENYRNQYFKDELTEI